MRLLTPLLVLLATAGAAAQNATPPAPAATPACIACRADVPRLRQGYTAAEWQALRGGRIVTRSTHAPVAGAARGGVEASVVLPYAPAQVWQVLADFPARPEFMPNVKEVRVVRTAGDRVWLAERARVWWRTIRYQLAGTLEPAQGRMTWVLDPSAPHDIADSRGAWQLAPLGGGAQTLVQYRAQVDIGRAIPHFIEQLLIKHSLPKILGGLRDEVQRRFPYR